MLDGYEDRGLRQPQATAGSLMEQVISPGIFRASEVVRRFSPAGYAGEIRQKCVHAGKGEARSTGFTP
ncbi:MAG: hypothetical protein R2704_09635 [Microthrixaceae bacterium]